ncbi:MAG: cAMP receptor protein [Acidobacteria bacterium ADurb.Bin340]|nr:MAG: cAMP receptor protein [Acidobacteria bacterium ADurb.Bin340]HQL47876.1 Crp/Fnr family transcriptional regulator [Holophaga sp.]
MGQAVINLRRVEYLAGLPQPEAEELASVSELRRYADGAPVFNQGEHSPGIFVVVQGALKVYRTDGRGKIQVLDILQPGTCVGEVQVFDGGVTASGAEAHGDTECWFIPSHALKRMVLRSPAVSEVIIRHFAGKVRHLIQLVETLSLHSVPERVAQLILDYHSRTNSGRMLVEFGETQEDLAQCIGASREAFSRALRLLADLSLIQSTFPVVRILDVQKLQRYAKG